MKLKIWYGIFLGLLIGCNAPPSSKKNVSEELANFFDKEFSENEPGGVIAVVKDEEIVFSRSYGLADLETKEKITPQTLFNTGSVSKTFVSNTILALAEENKLSLTDSISKFFPDFKNKQMAERITIQHLLTHTSGLPDNRRVHHDSVFLLTARDAENFAPIKLNDSLLFEPGTRFDYSNPAFNGLALIIEKVTGKKWQDVVKEKIFDKAGMTQSTIQDGPYPEKGVAHAYLKINGTYIEKDYGEEPTFAAAGNGGVWSSAEELIRYEIALRKSVFLPSSSIERSRTITNFSGWKGEEAPFIGYSWFIAQTEDSVKVVSHTGTQGGFYCDYVSLPSKNLLYVILCNRPFKRSAYRENVISILKKNNWIE